MWENFNVKLEKNTFANIPSGDLRISILSECNMKCVYCHSEGCVSKEKLSLEEIVYIVKKSMAYGIKQIRLTGGEPLLHKDITEICSQIKKICPNVHLGINTNGILIDKIIEIVDKGIVDRIVVGLDYFDAAISKNSPFGHSSKKIRDNIIKIKEHGCSVEVDAVYDGDYLNIYSLAKWCLENHIRFKILELIDDTNSKKPKENYVQMIKKLTTDLDLTVGINNCFDDLFAYDKNKTEISFFHSLCRTQECSKCARMHMRVTSLGKAKPCLKNKETEFELLCSNFDDNMRKAIYNLGISP